MRLPLVLIALGAGLLAAPPLAAQQPTMQEELRLTRQEIERDREKIVRAALPLSEEQAARFWPLYQEFRLEQQKVGDLQVKAVTAFAGSYESLDDATAKAVLDDWLKANEQRTKLAQKWHGKFAKAIGERNTLRFYQLEGKLNHLIQGETVMQIPLAR